MITSENLYLFNKLRTKRLKGWETFSDPEYIKVWEGVIEKYPETAHFIYELIQNADDALASEATIILFRDHLIFKHNGKRQFSLSNVDKLKDGIGDINSITAVGYSTKADEEQKIGKFGVGFKSVFQYTDTPTIYDDTFWFKIENYMIPELVKKDHTLRSKGETLFDIPFKQPEKAFNEIYGRLQKLNMPVLFLPNIKKITWKIDGENTIHTYSKTILQSKEKNNINYEFCKLQEYDKVVKLYLFGKKATVSKGIHKIGVGYFLNDDGTLNITIRPNVYCFFPTREKFDGCFVSHAPFLLTDNRDSIKSYEEVNTEFLHEIAKLAAESLIFLRDIKKTGSKIGLLNDNLFALLNIKSLENRDLFLKTQYENCVKENKLVLSRSSKYIETGKALVTTEDLEQLINKKQLCSLYGDGYDFVYINNYRSDLRTIANGIGIATFDAESLAMKLTSSFMGSQPKGWTNKLINYIKENARKLWNTDKERSVYSSSYYKSDSWENLKFRFAPIAKASNGEWVAPYSLYKEQANIMLPFEVLEDATEDDFGLILDKKTYESYKDFYEHLGLRKPNIIDYIEKKLLCSYDKPEVKNDVLKKDFVFFYNYLKTNEDAAVVKLLKEKWKVVVTEKGESYLYPVADLFVPDQDLVDFAGINEEIKFIDCEFYSSNDCPVESVIFFFKKCLYIKDYPPIIRKGDTSKQLMYHPKYGNTYTYSHFPERIKQKLNSVYMSCSKGPSYEDYYLLGYKIEKKAPKWSKLLWEYLIKNKAYSFISGTIKYYGYRKQYSNRIEFDSTLLLKLKEDKWICKGNGDFCKPSELTVNQFHNMGYAVYSELENVLGFCEEISENLPVSDFNIKETEDEEMSEYKRRTDELLIKVQKKGIDINALLEKVIEGDEDNNVIDGLENFELPTIDTEIDDILSSISTGIEDIDLPYFDYFKDHEADIIDYIDGLDRPKSMVRSTIGFIGRLIYEQYLIDNNIPYEKAEGSDAMYYDYKINEKEQYVTIRTTEKSIIDRNFDIGLRAAQNAFLKEHPNAQFRMVRISITDINVEPEYKDIIGLYGKEIDPSMDDRFLKRCRKLAQNYWKGATITEFDEASPEYLIKIERKN